MRQNRDWLTGQISFDFLNVPEPSHNPAERPQKSFQECTNRSQKRKLKSLLETNTSDKNNSRCPNEPTTSGKA